MYADSGSLDPYFNPVLSGLHNPNVGGAVTNALQISVNPQKTRLMAVGNFTAVDGQNAPQIARFNIANAPTVGQHRRPPEAVQLVDDPVTQACSVRTTPI